MITAALLICLAPVAYDGDTVKCGNTRTSIRVFGIQAPEKGQAGDPASTANLQAEVQGGLICEPNGTSYSRVVALCTNAQGVDIGLGQLGGGFAVEWCAYSKNYYRTCP